MAVPISAPALDPLDAATSVARALLCAQGVVLSSVEATAAALGLLLARSGPGPLPRPVVLSGEDAAHACGFDRRTWWIVKRRLLALGHLVGPAGDGPRGRLGGRGRKGAYFVSPDTFRRFVEARRAGITNQETVMQTVMSLPETVMQTVMQTGKSVMSRAGRRSQHRLSSLSSEKTSDVFRILEGRTRGESANAEALETLGAGETVGAVERDDRVETVPGSESVAGVERREPFAGTVGVAPEDGAPKSHHKSHHSNHHSFERRAATRSTASRARSRAGSASGPRPDAREDPLSWLGERVLAARAPGKIAGQIAPQIVRQIAPPVAAPDGPEERAPGPREQVVDSREIRDLLAREPDPRVRVALVRLLERALVLERVDRCEDPRERRALLGTLARRGTLAHRGTLVRRASGETSRGETWRGETSRGETWRPGPVARVEPEPRGSGSSGVGPSGAPPLAPLEPVAARPSDAAKTVNASPSASLNASRGAPSRAAVAAPSVLPKAAERSERRRARAPHPLWSPDEEPEKRATFAHVGAILELANRDFGASFDLERSRRDTLLYPYEVVRGGVANVLLKKARGYKFENPGAVLWDAITVPGYRLEEFAVANLEEVEKRCAGAWTPPATLAPTPPVSPRRARDEPSDHEKERRRIEARRRLYEGLPADVREDLDRRAREAARAGFAARGTSLDDAVFGLRVLRARDDLLEREHAPALASEPVSPRD